MRLFSKTSKNRLDFIIAGAEKAGTSYMSRALEKSEEILLPEQEVRHFRDPFYPDRERLDDLLAGKNGARAGIKHPSYLGKPEVPKRIREHNKEIKLIFILRDPVERAISSYLHYIRHGQVPLLHPDLGIPKMVVEGQASLCPKYRDILEFGLYHKYLALYLEHFKKEQLLILEYEEFLKGTVDMSPVTDFLGISPIKDPPLSRINEGTRDWHSCALDFIRALAFNNYDEGLNIVGRSDHPYLDSFDGCLPQLRQSIAAEPLTISETARAALRSFYENDMAALKQSRLLQPLNW